MLRQLIILCFVFAINIFSQNSSTLLLSGFHVKGNFNINSSKIDELLNFKTNENISIEVIENGINNVLKWYEENGFPFATIEVENLQIDSSNYKISFSIKISEGSLVEISNIEVLGNLQTSSNVVKREAVDLMTQIYRQSQINKIKNRLEKLQLFSSIETSLKIIDTNTVLIIKVTETHYNSFDGIAGYLPSPNGKGILTGLVKLGFKNITGTGRKLFVDWEKENQNSHNYIVKYSEPWIFNLPVDANFSIRQRKHENLFTNFALELNNAYKFSEEVSISVSYFNSTVTPNEEQKNLISFSEENLYGGILAYDSRITNQFKKSGIYFITKVLNGNKNLKLNDSLTSELKITRTNILFENNYEFINDAVFYNLFSFNTAIASHLEVSDRVPLGGTTTLRGYRENQFFGTSTLFLQNEVRFYTQEMSHMFSFVDLGMFWNDKLPIKNFNFGNEKKLLAGFGAGIRLQTGSWLLSFTLGFGKDDKINEGKIHVGMQNEF